MQSVLDEIKDELHAAVQQRQRADRDTLRRLAMQQAEQRQFSAKDKASLVEVLQRIGRDLEWFEKLVKVATQKLEFDHWQATDGSPETQAELNDRRTAVMKERRELLERARVLEIEEANISAKQRNAGAMDGDIRTFQILNPLTYSVDGVQPREFDRIPLTFDQCRQAKHSAPGELYDGSPRRVF